MVWNYVPTALNTADILSRGALSCELCVFLVLIHGPSFLPNSADAAHSSAHLWEDIQSLRIQGTVSPSSCLASLSPFVDQFGLFRVDERLWNSSVHFNC